MVTKRKPLKRGVKADWSGLAPMQRLMQKYPDVYRDGRDRAQATDHDPEHPDAGNPWEENTEQWYLWNWAWNMAPVKREEV